MISVEEKKTILLDKISDDIKKEKVNLYKILDGDKYLPIIISQHYPLEKFIHISVDYLNEFYSNYPFKEIFVSLVKTIVDSEEEFVSFHKQREMIYEFFNSLEDIEYGKVSRGDYDFELLMEILKEDMVEKEGVE